MLTLTTCACVISLHFCFNCQIHRQLFNSNLRQLASEHLHIRVSVQFIYCGVPYGQKYNMWRYNVYVLFLWSAGSTEHQLRLFRKGQSNDILLTAPWLLLIEWKWLKCFEVVHRLKMMIIRSVGAEYSNWKKFTLICSLCRIPFCIVEPQIILFRNHPNSSYMY